MIEVRIRREEDATAVWLCNWDPTDLDGVIRMLANQGVRDGEGEHYAGLNQFRGEIVLEDGSAFFEIVLQAQD